jgi:transcriptional regulator with XRE-family HTH domain
MEQILNITLLKHTISRLGLNQTALAEKIGVTKESVSKWLKGSAFPRPNKILKLGMLLELSYEDLVSEKENNDTPIVAFRKKGNRKTKPEHYERAKNMGFLLRNLVKFLSFDKFQQPPTLKYPLNDYDYLQEVCKKIRKEIGKKTGTLAFEDLINKFQGLNAVIIPVFWGDRKNHENALHIYLPDSMTTWIFLNLDVNIHDFLFWMAHELGHVYAPNLREDEGEDFADAFAQTLLFPENLAKKTYKDIRKLQRVSHRISAVMKKAEELMISPNTIIAALKSYSERYSLGEINFGNYYGAITNFNKRFPSLSETIFEDDVPTAKKYIEKSNNIFETPFFDALKLYMDSSGKRESFVKQVLQVPLLDAKAIAEEL